MKLIFATLRAEAERQGGNLSETKLQSLEQIFVNPGNRMTKNYMNTYNVCMKSMPNGRATAFAKESMLGFYLNVHLQDVMLEIFKQQARRGQAQWRTAFCHGLGLFLRNATGAGIDEDLMTIYFDLGKEKGTALTAADLVGDGRGKSLVMQALRKLPPICREYPMRVRDLGSAINEHLRSRYRKALKDDLLVTDADLIRFLDALEALGSTDDTDGPENRKAVAHPRA